jgi:hypothetical protein
MSQMQEFFGPTRLVHLATDFNLRQKEEDNEEEEEEEEDGDQDPTDDDDGDEGYSE